MNLSKNLYFESQRLASTSSLMAFSSKLLSKSVATSTGRFLHKQLRGRRLCSNHKVVLFQYGVWDNCAGFCPAFALHDASQGI